MNEKPSFKFALREDLKDQKQFLPKRSENRASGWDVFAAMPDKQPLVIKPFQHVKIPLGFRAFCPEGWWFELKPRSSTFAKKYLHSLYGTIDNGFEGQLQFSAQYIPTLTLTGKMYFNSNPSRTWEFGPPMPEPLTIQFQEAIGQIIPVKLQEMEVVDISNEEYDALCAERKGERGTKGFGEMGG